MGRAGKRQPAASACTERAQVAVDAAMGAAVAPTVVEACSLQSLWAGYGEVIEATTDDEHTPAAIVIKAVAPPPGSGVSHLRKLASYRIEAAFYEGLVPRLPPAAACHVPRCLGVHSTLGAAGGGGGMQLVLSDLRGAFPRR